MARAAGGRVLLIGALLIAGPTIASCRPMVGAPAGDAAPSSDLGPGHYVAVTGDDAGPGTATAPWRTLKASVAKLKPGDVLYVGGGTYDESNILIGTSGTPEKPVVVAAAPGQQPVVNGSYPEFRRIGNDDWVVHDPAMNIYKSRKTFADPGDSGLTGFFYIGQRTYSLIPYRATLGARATGLDYLASNDHDYNESAPRYMGPGVVWNASDQRIYVRLQPSSVASVLGRDLPSLADLDPRHNRLELMPNNTCIRVAADNVIVEGIATTSCWTTAATAPGSSNVTFRSIRSQFGRFGYRLSQSDHVTIENADGNGFMPPWLGWTDVKGGEEPAKNIRKNAVDLGASSFVEVRNSRFDGAFDGILTGAGHDIKVLGNTFSDIWDDMFQIPVQLYNVEIAYNKVLGAGPSHDAGSGTAVTPGTKYIHHNVIDTTTYKIMWTRNDPRGINDAHEEGMLYPIAFSSHGTPVTDDPWKIYQNTVISGGSFAPTIGVERWAPSARPTGVRHEVFNNIFLLREFDYAMRNASSAGATDVSDGNVYWGVNGVQVIFLEIRTSTGQLPRLDSLQQLKSSAAFNESRTYYAPGWESRGVQADPQLRPNYRPSADGPAASGAVDLSLTGWPGTGSDRWRGALAP